MTPITRLFDFPYYQLEKNNLSDCLVTKYDGEWIKTSTQEYIKKANAISRALLRLGVLENDKIAIISTSNRTEWNIIDIGILQVGAQNVPIYPTIGAEDYEYILNHSESKYCFVSDVLVYEKIKSVKDSISSLKEIYSFNEIEGCKNWKTLLELGKDESNQNVVEDRKTNVNTNDLATIIYTSGTTGKPKGVMLSHDNIVSNVFGGSMRIPFTDGNYRTMSYLPVCHILERFYLYLCQYNSISIYFGESLDKIGENLKEVKPQLITGVPRVLEKIYDKIYSKGLELKGIKKILFFWAINLGMQFEPYEANGWWYEFQLKIARKLIFSKWKEAVGENLQLIACGSAALQPRLARIFAAAEITIMEGYGLTETSPIVAINDMRDNGFKIGTVGKVIDKVHVKIAEDGEILCKGPNVMLGYYKDEAQTKEVMTDGYFHTGDIGEIDSEGFLKITDRKKEMFKTSGGKYVSPQLLENAMKQSRFIEQIMVIGDGQKMPAAFIQPNFTFVKEWERIHGIDIVNTNEEIISNPKLIERIQEEINLLNKKFGSWEQIKRFELTPDIWSIDAGHLTPTMKLKRKVIMEKYKDLYDKIYS
jgi:long-chain acyl-CoA synthetase